MRPKLVPVKDPVFYKAWAAAHTHCQCCAATLSFPPLSTHHIVRRGRSDEACNLLRLCGVCHDLAEHRTRTVSGVRIADLTLGMCLRLKSDRDPGDFKRQRLEELYGQTLPDLSDIPRELEALYRLRRPWEAARFSWSAEESSSV